MRSAQVAFPVAVGMTIGAAYSCSLADLTSGAALDVDGGPIEASSASDASTGETSADAPALVESGIVDAGPGTSEVAFDASSWPGPTGAVMLENALSKKYLNASIPPGDASAFTPGVPVVTWSYTGATNQCWTFQHLGADDSYELLTDTGRCLDDPNGNADSGTPMQQYQCWLGSNYNQRWYLVNDQGHLNIVGKASGKCLTSTSNQDGVSAYISDCSTNESVQWILLDCP